MIYQELGAPPEEVRQRRAPLVRLEAICLVNAHPGEVVPPLRQVVAAARQLLLRLKQIEPRRQPLFPVARLVVRHCCAHWVSFLVVPFSTTTWWCMPSGTLTNGPRMQLAIPARQYLISATDRATVRQC